MSSKNKKHLLFDKYAKNLEYLLKNIGTDDSLPEGGGYVCPLGLTLHDRDGLSKKYADQLTEEHVPPRSLGGNGICLTRKDLNSTSGHTLDNALLNNTRFAAFNEGLSSYRAQVNFGLPKLSHLNGEMLITKEEKKLWVKFGKKNQALFEKAISEKDWVKGLEMKLNFNVPRKKREFLVGLLRTGYLLAFNHIGYALLIGPKKFINPHFDTIRNQILHPEKEIIPFFPILKNTGPRINGLGIVTSPENLKSLFVTFPLNYESHTDYYTVFLPAPDEKGFDAYSTIGSLGGNKKSFDLKYQEMRPIDYHTSAEKARLFHVIWNNLNKE